MSSKKRNQEEETETNDEAFAGKKSDGKHVPGNDDGPLSQGPGNIGTGNGEGDGDQQTDKSDEGSDQQQDQSEVNDGGLGKNLEDESENESAGEEEEFKGKTYGDAFKDKDGNPRRHSWPEGQKVEFFETVAYLSYPPDGARKDLYIPTEEDIKATDWE